MSSLLYFAITIGILVFIHEFGHFAAAKLCGMRADIFAIGFGKRLFGYNKITGFTFGELAKDFDGAGNTDYRLNLIPLGGYVKIAGMVDESFDVSFAGKEPQPYEFRAKPTMQKVFVITAGVLMNLLLALIISWGDNYFQPKEYWKTTTVGYVTPKSGADQNGFKINDKILAVNGNKVEYWQDLIPEIAKESVGKQVSFQVLRNGESVTINVKHEFLSSEQKIREFLFPSDVHPRINDVMAKSPALKAGIKPGDILLNLNNTPLVDASQTTQIISSNKNVTMPLVVLRDNKDTIKLSITPGADGKVGIGIGHDFTGQIELRSYGFTESFYYGAIDIYMKTSLTLVMFKRVITREVEFSKAFGGPIAIAKYASKSADYGIAAFLSFLGLLSLSLAIINILPFPALDGGHFVMIIIEGIIKREIPLKIKIAIQNTGFILLLILMAFIVFNDIINLWFS